MTQEMRKTDPLLIQTLRENNIVIKDNNTAIKNLTSILIEHTTNIAILKTEQKQNKNDLKNINNWQKSHLVDHKTASKYIFGIILSIAALLRWENVKTILVKLFHY